jgi:hypothetical protein
MKSSARSSKVSKEEGAMLKSFLNQSVTKGTARSYQASIDKWKEYLSTLDPDCHPGDFLERMESQHEKAKRIVLFMAYLYMSEGLRDEQIKRAVTGVSYMFEVEGMDASFMELAMVSRGRTATCRSIEECRAYEEVRGSKVILPVCLDIVLSVRDQYWVNQDWSTKGIDKRGIWLAISIGFDSGLRIGNLTKRDGPNGADHCIRAGQLTFFVIDPQTNEEKRLKGGPLTTAFLERQDVPLSAVSSVDMTYVTSKTSRKVKSLVNNPKTISRRTAVESMVLDDLLSWFLHSRVQEGDELLTRYSNTGSRKVVIRKDVRTAIKLAVQGAGLPPRNFSTKSLRSGFGTHVTANGMGSDEMKSRGGWVKDSTVPDNHYVRRMHNRGALALAASSSGDQMHGVEEIARMLPSASNDNN